MSVIAFRELPDPEKHGWLLKDNTYLPVPYKGKVAPDSIMNLVKCGCSKTNCRTSRCKCYKANMTCTDLCQCSDKCENCDLESFVVDNQELNDDSFRNMKLYFYFYFLKLTR